MEATTIAPDRRLADLYEEHGNALRSFVTRLSFGDSHLAEDVVQETFVRAWRYTTSDASEPPGRAWLFTVARRLFIDGIRRRSVRPPETRDETVLALIPEADRIDELLTSVVIGDALTTLSPAHRAVVHEVYLRGSNIDEAARTLNIPPGTVKSRLHYGLKALRSALQERDVIPTR